MTDAAKQRVVSPEDKALAGDFLKRIEAAAKRHDEVFRRFDENRKLLRGIDPANNTKIRTNLYFSNLAAMRPQVYAKDPEFTVKPGKGVPDEQLKLVQRFGQTAEAVLDKKLVQEAKLKRRAKRLLTSAFTTTVGWWKCAWQEKRKSDPLIVNRIKDTQDNIDRLESLREGVDEAQGGNEQELKLAQLRETLEGLQAKAEVTVAKGPTLDFVLSEDILILDDTVREVADYERASAIAHRVWMSPSQYKQRFGYDCAKGKTYTEKQGSMTQDANGTEKDRALLCVWEVWEQDSNRVFHVCEGEEGFCDPPMSPDWTGERWYPFFLIVFNEVDGAFYPPSDVELIKPLVEEYNTNRADLVRDRKGALPLNIVRKGGALTHEDLDRIKNREGSDLVQVEGVGGQPISNDIWSGTLGQLNPANYDTAPARSDIEQLLGGGDASRGTVMKAKTATEAEILSQGLRSRSAERQDTMEDLLSEVGTYVLEMCLRKLSEQEVKEIAGADAVWPALSAEQIFKQVSVEVLGGSTGKPDRLQDQDRWTKLLPVIEKTLAQVAELRANGGEQQAEALIALVKETLRRFEERLDIDQFLPEKKEGEQPQDPMQDPRVQQLVQEGQAMIQELQAKVAELEKQVNDKQAEVAASVQIAEIDAASKVRIAEVTAPIEAAAKVEVARITALAKPEPMEPLEQAEPMEPEPQPF